MAAKYKVVIRDFADTTTFGPGPIIAVIENATNVGHSEYLNEVSEAFFSMSQEDPKIALLSSATDLGKHVWIYRNGVHVWGGWLGEADENLHDVVFTAYNYLSGFYHYIMPWDKEWTGINAHTIIEETFDYAKGLSKSRVGWLTKDTIQSLYITNGAGTLALPLYRAPYKRALTVFREIAAYAISDTTNRVKFLCQPGGNFFLLRNDTTRLNTVTWRLGDGKVRNYNRLRMPVDRRNEILAVGSSPKDTVMRKTITKTANRDAGGLKQEPIYMSWVRNADELDRITKIRANRAVRVDTDLYLAFYKDTVIPYRATGQDYQIGDEVTFSLNHGLTSASGDIKIVVGQQVIYSQGSEFVRVLLQDRIS
jgi:hypothetical protein